MSNCDTRHHSYGLAMKLLRKLAGVVFMFILLGTGLVYVSSAELISVGHADEAIRALNQQLQSNPGNAEAYSLLCRVYYLVDDWDNAIANGERAVRLNSKVASYHLWLGRAYGGKAESVNPVFAFSLARKVAREFERAYNLDPGDWKIRRDLAEFYVEAPAVVGGGEQKAERLASLTQTSDPTGAGLIRAMIAYRRKNWNEAEHQYKIAIDASGGAAEPWLELARFYRYSRRWDAFDDAVRHALNSPKKSPENLFDAGELLAGTGRMLPQAVEVLHAYLRGNIVEEYGTAFRAHYLLGQVMEKQGNKQAAIGEYRNALTLASNYHPAQDALRRLGA